MRIVVRTVAASVLLLAGVAAPTRAQDPQPTVPAMDTVVSWTVGAPTPAGATTQHPSRRATRIRVGYSVGACGNPRLTDTRVQRGRRRIVVTLTVHTDAVTGACPAIAILRTVGVDLGGRLGRRAVFDGAPDPDERRIAVPPARG